MITTNTIKTIISVATLAAFTFHPLQLSADDTEIFGSNTQTGGAPNMFFMLDLSGSMSEQVMRSLGYSPGAAMDGYPIDRLQRMKNGLIKYLSSNETVNVNVGLGTFRSSKPAINAPLRPIDQVIERGTGTAISRIDRPNDDAMVVKSVVGTIPYQGNPVTIGQNVLDLDNHALSTYRNSTSSATVESGLLFRGLEIPQGAKITSAFLTLTSAKDIATTSVTVDINAQSADQPADFATTIGNITSRTKTTATYQWAINQKWNKNQAYTTGDLKAVIQEVVDRTTWCGGNKVVLLLNGGGDHRFYSRDHSSGFAPQLTVNYDYSEITTAQGCVQATKAASVGANVNDTDEYILDGDYEMPRYNKYLQLGDFVFTREVSVPTGQQDCYWHYWYGRICEDVYETKTVTDRKGNFVGLRFNDVNVPENTVLTEAKIQFVASTRGNNTDLNKPVTAKISVDKRVRAPSFRNRWNGRRRLRDRDGNAAVNSASLTWNITSPWVSGQAYQSIDIKSLIQPLLNNNDWDKDNNAIAIVLDTVGSTGRRNVISYDDDPTRAPKLILKFRTNVKAYKKTVRDELIEIVQNLDAGGATPIVDSLYESGLYYNGDAVDFGATPTQSRADTYTGSLSGGAKYNKPQKPACGGKSNLILLTDGAASHNDAGKKVYGYDRYGRRVQKKNRVEKKTGAFCAGSNDSDRCGEEITRYHRDVLEIKTSAIAFGGSLSNLSSDHLLRKIARAGDDPSKNGQPYSANNEDDLLNIFKQVEKVSKKEGSGSFVAPTVSVNAFNRLVHRSEAYLSMFSVDESVAWKGNVKKYGVCEDRAANRNVCKVGELMSSDTTPEPVVLNGKIKSDAKSYWLNGATADGEKVNKGGAGARIGDGGLTARQVYTFTGGNTATSRVLSSLPNKVVGTNASVTKGLLGNASMTNTERDHLIHWIRGYDMKDEDDDGIKNEKRWAHADPLHSSPFAFNVGGTDANPVIKMIYGANDGGIRLVNANSGKEEWVFFPRASMNNQYKRFKGGSGDIIYGVDGSPTVWIKDAPASGRVFGDGIIDRSAGEFVKAFIGMRRGGRNIYALNITPSRVLTATDADQTDKMRPTYMWRIDGGSGNFTKLGQTWSKPKRVKVKTNAGSAYKDVLIFAGGYDDSVDNNPAAASNAGNAIFIVDANTGQRLWWMSNESSGANVQHPNMDYAIPSDVAVIDNDADGAADRIYVGDVHGQVWRVDLGNNIGGSNTLSGAVKPIAKRFANIANFGTRASQRAFFYEPQIISVKDTKYSSSPRYDMVMMQSGFRPSPLSEGVQDRMYAFRDYLVDGLVDADNNGIADIDNSTPLKTSLTKTLTESDLFNTSTTLVNTSTATLTIRAKSGYYFDLPTNHKGISVGTALFGIYFFNAYSPDDNIVTVNECQSTQSQGTSKLYAIDILSGLGIVKNENGELITSDDASQRNTGFQADGLTGAPSTSTVAGDNGSATIIRVGPVSLKLTTANNRFRTYWSQGSND